jgi:hypothetical protein
MIFLSMHKFCETKLCERKEIYKFLFSTQITR